MRRFIALAFVATACTAPNREHDDPAELCDYDPPPVYDVFRIDGDGEPKGWTGFVDGRQVHWVRYQNGDPYAVTDGALRARCYPGRAPAEVCAGDPADGCECYLPDGDEVECETAWQVLDGFYKVDVRRDGADSAR